jgi:parallel beta-helix repeat protein
MRPFSVTAAVGLVLALPGQPPPQARVPEAGLVIDSTTRLAPGRYRLPSTALDRPALVVRGENITLDLTGVTLEGGDPAADPDSFTGMGLAVEGKGITIRGGVIRGYKVGILARRSPRLHVTGADLSFNWKPRLKSGIEQEDQSDWLSFHNNERDQWLRYGAAIYLSESDDAEIDRVRAVQGMNGLMVTRSARLTIWNNTFSWLSGVGLGLYRTTDSRIFHNRLDWCVRGYSHGFYNRGQDSTGMLLYEQSSRNIVAFNSITHGGDGVFLWAGQSTMDTGEGGANDNVFYANDVSHAVANGIEATFSRNIIVGNRIDDSWHGIWGGYSFDTLIADNTFEGNTEGIAIEHGQRNTITGNRFSREETAIRLWANTSQDPNWGYPKHRDTLSRDYVIARNRFDGEKTALDVLRTSSLRLVGNEYRGVTTPVKTGVDVANLVEGQRLALPASPAFTRPVPMRGGMDAKLAPGARRGRGTIIVDDWGPYDYRSLKLWPAGAPGERPLRLRVLGPPGRWTVASIHGGSAMPTSGVVPGEVVVTPPGTVADFTIDLEYRGAEVVTPRGQVIPAGQPSHATYTLFDTAIAWTVKFWKFDAATDPLTARAAFDALLASAAPVRTEQLPRLAFANAAAFGAGFTTRIGLTAEGSVSLPKGTYRLSVTSDDGIRLWVDGRLVLEDWTIHGPKEDRLTIEGGEHHLRIQYFQNTGAAALIVKIVRP